MSRGGAVMRRLRGKRPTPPDRSAEGANHISLRRGRCRMMAVATCLVHATTAAKGDAMAAIPTYALPPTFLGTTRADAGAAICVAGIPFDLGTTNRSGARFGPQAIRQASRMLVDGARPGRWLDPAELSLADIGNFALALGDIPASLAAIEDQ
ncbi:MAG TPA: arginase family protein, partial [Stellaceae bacterium]